MRLIPKVSILLLCSPIFTPAAKANLSCEQLVKNSSSPLVYFSLWKSSSNKFPRRLKNRFSEAMEHLEEDLTQLIEKDVSELSKNMMVLNALKDVDQKLPEVLNALKVLKSEAKGSYFGQIENAIWALLSVHAHEVIELKSMSDQKLGRFLKILKSLSEFDPSNPQFSLYKFKRTIEGEFSLRDFIRCRL